jgi:hypothetical protein
MTTDIQEEEKKEQQYQEHLKKKQQQEELIDWRRGQVIELISKGKSLTQIAEILKVDVSTISRDYQYIRENANSILKNFLLKFCPLKLQSAYLGLPQFQMKRGKWLSRQIRKVTEGHRPLLCP